MDWVPNPSRRMPPVRRRETPRCRRAPRPDSGQGRSRPPQWFRLSLRQRPSALIPVRNIDWSITAKPSNEKEPAPEASTFADEPVDWARTAQTTACLAEHSALHRPVSGLFGPGGGIEKQFTALDCIGRNLRLVADDLPVTDQLLDRVPFLSVLAAEGGDRSPIQTFQGGTIPDYPGVAEQEWCQPPLMMYIVASARRNGAVE